MSQFYLRCEEHKTGAGFLHLHEGTHVFLFLDENVTQGFSLQEEPPEAFHCAFSHHHHHHVRGENGVNIQIQHSKDKVRTLKMFQQIKDICLHIIFICISMGRNSGFVWCRIQISLCVCGGRDSSEHEQLYFSSTDRNWHFLLRLTNNVQCA